MVSLFVVFEHPGPADFADFIKIAEQPGVGHLVAVAAVEAFDVGVLVWLARLDVVDHHAVRFAPRGEHLAQELGAIVSAQHVRQAAFGLQLFEHAHQPFTGERGIDLDAQRFTVEVIEHVEGPEPYAVVKRIAHEVGGPHLVGP